MKLATPPTTNAISYFDHVTNEWVTTFTVRHKVNSDIKPEERSKIPGLDELIESLKKTSLSPDSIGKYELPTLNQKILGS